MPYELNANLEQQYVHLKYTGTIELAERMQAKDDVIALCFDSGLHRSLVDLRDSDIQMSESDVIRFASSFKNTKLPDNYRLAVITGPDNQTDNLIEIIISIDGIDVKYFFDSEEAINWLTAV